MTEEEANMRFIQELLTWVEEMQVSLVFGSFKLTLWMKNVLKCILFFPPFLHFKVAAGPLGVGQRFAKCGNPHR